MKSQSANFLVCKILKVKQQKKKRQKNLSVLQNEFYFSKIFHIPNPSKLNRIEIKKNKNKEPCVDKQ